MSPIRSSSAAGTSHAYGDDRFSKQVVDVPGQRLEGRKTGLSGAVSTTATLNQTPTIGNYLIVMLSSNAALVPPACSYSGTAGTTVVNTFATGICAFLYYIPVTSISSGTTLNITSATGPTIIGYAIAEFSNVYATTPVDYSNSNTTGTSGGTWGSATHPTIFQARTTIGCSVFSGISLSGSQTTGGVLGGVGGWDTSGGTVGSHTGACDIYASSGARALSYSANGTAEEFLTGATARNGVWLYATFKPAA